MSSSIPSTLFIAVQCFHCSTMQVKQKKKSSNKWSCAVCGSRQSVTRVHAEGFMARDVRKFVQGFNMRRKIEDDAVLLELDCDRVDCEGEVEEEEKSMKRRTDWSEYADNEEEENGREFGGERDEVEAVTEWPEEMMRRQRRKRLSVDGDEGRRSGGDGTSRRNVQCGFEGKNTRQWPLPGSSDNRSTWNGAKNQLQYLKQSQVGQLKAPGPVAAGKQISKWSTYVTDDDDDFSSGRLEATLKGDCCARIKENTSVNDFDLMGRFGSDVSPVDWTDQMVEEDIHPDFA
ncbi:hypothetical protein Droror1_Dr00021043 [Drosera rotundifolia]